jgi:hypothetical protein
MLPDIVDPEPLQIWFGQRGYVLRTDDETFSVMIGDTLVGTFAEGDVATRDVLIAIVVENLGRSVSWSEVAQAFRVGRATVGRAMQRFYDGGLRAVANAGHRGGPRKRTPQLDRRVFGLFEQGLGVRAAHRVVARRVSYGTVQTLHQEWLAQRSQELDPAQLSLRQCSLRVDADSAASNDNGSGVDGDRKVTHGAAEAAGAADVFAAPEPSRQAVQREERTPEELLVEGRSEFVQHIGSWILLALLGKLGVYEEAARWSSQVSRVTLRVVFDAIAIALAIGEGCVEGVRRIATPSAPLLLRHNTVVGAVWVRNVLGRFAAQAALMFRARVTARLVRRFATGRERVWLYVDNHGRRYTGQETLRKVWRMQDKRAVPGTTDYYVHDEDGHPLWRVTSKDHESLSAWLPRVLELARMVLGQDVEIILSFDRGGSNPEVLAGLRDLEGSFITYEKKPYAPLAKTEFTEQLEIVLPSQPNQPTVIRYTETRARNLGKGRGRVRRIALLGEDGRQINVLTCSRAPAEELIRGHLGRWGKQENQFKYGAGRWGINQLDSRHVEPYPPDAIVPEPDRARLERKIQLARAAEGRARCELAALGDDPSARQRLLDDIEWNIARRLELEALRPTTPKRAPVRDTSLAGRLVRHTTEYKDVLDTLRIAFANVEADVAASLAPLLERPREAKKVVANLLAAPGHVRLGTDRWRVRLMPPATADERRAIAALLRDLNRDKLALPGDPTRRPLHFSLARSPDP